MKANELIHGGLYLIHDISDIVVRYDIVSNSFRSEWYEYPLALFHEDVCATEGDRYIFVKPIPLTEEILKKNGFEDKNENITRKFVEVDCGNIYSAVYILQNNRLNVYHCNHKVLNIKTFYVHELQHALRLCGLNELANNFKI